MAESVENRTFLLCYEDCRFNHLCGNKIKEAIQNSADPENKKEERYISNDEKAPCLDQITSAVPGAQFITPKSSFEVAISNGKKRIGLVSEGELILSK